MCSDEIRYQVLLLPGFPTVAVEHLLETVKATHIRLHHLRQGALFGMLWSNLEVPTHMVGHEFLDVFRRLNGQVITQPGSNQYFANAGQFTRTPVKADQCTVISVQVGADPRVNAGR